MSTCSTFGDTGKVRVGSGYPLSAPCPNCKAGQR